MSMLETLMQQLGGDNAARISRQLGTDEGQTQQAMGAALPTILEALHRNASKPEGAEALHRALENDHDGSVLDNLPDFLGKSDAGPGDGILRHVLGERRSTVEKGIGQASGLGEGSTSRLMKMLAPMVMGALGREQRTQGLDASSLAGMLGRERSQVEQKAPEEMGLVGRLLDADGDGDLDISDFVKRGSGVLGKLFGR